MLKQESETFCVEIIICMHIDESKSDYCLFRAHTITAERYTVNFSLVCLQRHTIKLRLIHVRDYYNNKNFAGVRLRSI